MKRTKLLRTSSLTALCAMGAAFVGPAVAQETGDDSELRADTIIVTATRRAEGVQDIPLNIAAVGEAQIEEQGFDELSDVLAYVPGINVVDRGGRQGNPIIVRGLNAEALGSGDGNNDGGGTVATYLGDIPVFVDLKLNDMQRVEVLLGPQGTLYGAGTLGGAIRYIPNRPDFDADTFEIRGGVYQYSEADSLSHEFGFTANKSLGDMLAIRGSLDISDDSGFIDYPFVVQEIGVSDPDPDFTDPAAVSANLRTIEDADSEETVSGRLGLRFQPTEWLDTNLTYYYQEADIGGRTLSSRRAFAPAGDFDSGLRVAEPNLIKNELIALEATADLGFAELTSATGYSEFSDEGQRDQTDLLITLQYSYELFPSFTSFTREVGEEERFNQEIRLVSTHDGPFNWIVGGFYNELKQVSSSSEFTPGYADFAGFVTPNQLDLEYFSWLRQETVEQALFGEVGFDITDRLNVTVGGRYYEYEIEAVSDQTLPYFPPATPEGTIEETLFSGPNTVTIPSLDVIGGLDFDPALEAEDDGTLFKFNASYDVTDDALVYFTISEGFRIGGANGVAQCDPFDPMVPSTQTLCGTALGQSFEDDGVEVIASRNELDYGPDTTTNYEIGFKSTWLGGDFVLNGAAYFIEWTDPQLNSATVKGNIPITVNAGAAESQGVELSFNWQVTESFNLRGSGSLTQAELTEVAPALVRATDNTDTAFGSILIDGQPGDRLPGSPEEQFSLFGSYVQPLSNGAEVTYNAGYSYQGDIINVTGLRGNAVTLDSYGVANASVVYAKDSWRATLFVNNLFDEYYETGTRSSIATTEPVLTDADGGPVNVRSYGAFVGAPRSIGVRFVKQFGG